MIADVKPFTPKDKKPYVRFTVQDVTGKMPGIVWGLELMPRGSSMSPGKFVRMTVSVSTYDGHLQLTSFREKVSPFQGEPMNIHDYVIGPSEPEIATYMAELRETLLAIEDPHYRDILCNAEQRLDLCELIASAPYGQNGPLACRGGLLIHVVHSLRMAKSVVENFGEVDAKINDSLIYAGCILRNMGWQTCTFFEGNILRVTDAFHMTEKYRSSFRFVHDLLLHVESDMQIVIPEGKKQALENICNPTRDIKTIEGKLVGHICNVADLMHFGDFCLRNHREGTGNWAPNNSNGFFLGHHDD
jgi:hypothetical protein